MSQQLRPYQNECVQAVLDAREAGYTRVLYTMATGTGKTTTFAQLTKQFLLNDWKVLILAHRVELITQAYNRVKDHCDLTEWDIGTEIAQYHAPSSAKVVVGSIMTVKGAHRLPDFKPDAIIVDEGHHGASISYQKLAERHGVKEGECFYVGLTATPRRTDRKSLYAIRPDGKRVQLIDKKTNRPYPADEKECVFQKLVYEYSILSAINDGWLVPVVGHVVKTKTDLSSVKTGTDGDFQDGQLEKAVDNLDRTMLAINAWKEVAADRPTLVFCAGVEHAHHSAELWRQAGYEAKAIDGKTDSVERFEAIRDFKSGKLQLLMNCGIFTEGTDLPTASCIVHLRPTKSWNLYVQISGRGTRPLPGIVDDTMTAEDRRREIGFSAKPDCLLLDLVDITEINDLCTAPSILDLPANLDLQGQSITDAQKMLEEFEEVKDRVIGECPRTFQELQTRLQQVSLIRDSDAKTKTAWMVSDDGFRYRHSRPGYQTKLISTAPGEYTLTVTQGKDVLLEKKSRTADKQGVPFKFESYLDAAARRASEAIERHAEANMPSRGTLTRLTPRQCGVLRANGHSNKDIDSFPYAKCKALISKYMDAWNAKKGA